VIVCRKPWTVYDVDVAGLVGLAVLAAASWWLAVAPWLQTWHGFRELARKQAAVSQCVLDDIVESDRREGELEGLGRVVSNELAQVPAAGALTEQLQRMTELARACDVELLSVTPQPPSREGPYWVSDIRVTGRGSCRNFIRLLDRLAGENPYASLRACSVARPPLSREASGELAWTVRLYLLPANGDGGDAEARGSDGDES
jgi:hypothetical protein